ncbi:MAG: hypothetical protein QM747_00675 [Nocardioides sp.]
MTPKSGVNFYVISCGQSVSTCSAPTEDMMEAAKAAGWSAHMADGKLSPDGFAAAIRQAIAGGANVIVPIGFDCMAAQAAFKEAKDAGITIIGGGGPDDCSRVCGRPSVSGSRATPVSRSGTRSAPTAPTGPTARPTATSRRSR